MIRIEPLSPEVVAQVRKVLVSAAAAVGKVFRELVEGFKAAGRALARLSRGLPLVSLLVPYRCPAHVMVDDYARHAGHVHWHDPVPGAEGHPWTLGSHQRYWCPGLVGAHLLPPPVTSVTSG